MLRKTFKSSAPGAPGLHKRACDVEPADNGRQGNCYLFRHSCATHMLANGADVRFISRQCRGLGHAKLETTRIYTDVSITQLIEVHERTHPARLEPTEKAKLKK